MVSTATVRANGESLRGYIAIFRGAQVLTADLTADADAQSETSLAISITAGSIADVQRGYRVQFFTSGGDFKGESHVRWSGTLDSTHLPVREFSQSEFLLETGDVVKVFALTAFADKLVEDDIPFNPDGKAVGTFNSAIAPLACSGGYDARFVDGFGTGTVQTYATITTDGSGCQNLDPDSTPGNMTHLWTLPTGVAFAPGSASSDASPTLRVNVGEYTVYHDVTDDDNSATWRQCVTYKVFSAASMPVPCLMDTPPMGDVEQGGWSCSFRALTPLTLEDAPDGSLAIFFVRERINGSWQSLGARSGREHVKACGYLSHDESDLTARETFQRFDLVSPFDRAGKLPGFSKIMIDTVSPDDWSEMETPLTTLRATVQIMRAYAWMLDGGHDLLVSDLYLNLPYPELALPKESPQQMVSDLADSVDAWFVCDRTGAFRLIPQFPLLDAADRATLTSAYTFDRRDILRLVMRRDHHDIVETLELHAIAATGDGSVAQATPVFSRAPGSPGHGAEFITVERIIADPDDAQNDANARAGRRYGMRNNVVTDATTGVKVRGLEIDLELRQVYDFLDFDDQIVNFASISNPRDIDLTALDWYFVRARLDYSSGRVISTFRALTDSPPGATYVPPVSQQPPYTPPVFVPQPPVGPVLPFPPWDGVLPAAGLVFSAHEGKVCRITGLAGAALVFGSDFTGVTNTEFYGGYSNPWRYRQCYGFGDAGIETSADITTDAMDGLLQSNASLFGGAFIGHRARGSIHRNGYGAIVSGSNYFRYTLDGWATLQSATSINGSALDPDNGSSIDDRCDFCECGHNAGHIYALANVVATGKVGLWKSTNYGATWALVLDLDPQNYPAAGRYWIDVPYMRVDGTPNRDDGDIEIRIYIGGAVAGDSGVIDGDGNVVNNAYPLNDKQNSGALNYNPFSSFTYDASYAYFCDGDGLRRTTDNYVTLSATLTNFAFSEGEVSCNGWSSNPAPVIFWSREAGGTGRLQVSLDGVTFIDGLPTGWSGGPAYCEFSLYTVQ